MSTPQEGLQRRASSEITRKKKRKLNSNQEGLWRRASSEIKRKKKNEFEENIKRQIIRKKKMKPNSSQEKLRRRASSEITRKKKMKLYSSQEGCGEEQVQRSKEKRKWSLKKTSRGKS